MTAAAPKYLTLDRALELIARRDGTVQIGWTPERTILLRPPPGVGPRAMIRALSLLDGRRSTPDVLWRAAELGLDASDMVAILSELTRVGVVAPVAHTQPVRRSVLVFGRGPLTERVASGLDRVADVERCTRSLPAADVDRDAAVFTDQLIPPPDVAAALMRSRTPHLVVRLRDGRGVLGPLVLPGHTSCLQCTDLTRCDYDPEWPHVAAQLLGRTGTADSVTTDITAVLAVAHVSALLAGPPAPAPASLGRTLEVDGQGATIRRRTWNRHRFCDCAGIPGRSVHEGQQHFSRT